MLEILTAEQPCIICAQPIEVVSWWKDEDTGEERIERTRLDHSAEECLKFVRLFKETWPCQPAR